MQGLGNELTVLADQLAVEIDLTATVVGSLDVDEIPVNGAAVPVVRDLVGLSRGEVEATGNLLVEEDIPHRLLDFRIEADGELPDVARSGIGIEDLVDRLGIVGGRLDDFSFLEFQFHVVEGDPLVDRGGIVADHAFDGILDGSGEAFSVGNIVSSPTGNSGESLDAETQVRARSHDVDVVGFGHQFPEGIHSSLEFVVFQQADPEVEILEGLGRHPGTLGHGGVGPTKDAPTCLVDALVEDWSHLGREHLHLLGWHVGQLVDIVTAPDRDVAIHILHLVHRVLGDRGILLLGRSASHLPADLGIVDIDERSRFHSPDLADQSDAHLLGNIEQFDQHILASLGGGRVADELAGELVDARIMHGGSLRGKRVCEKGKLWRS